MRLLSRLLVPLSALCFAMACGDDDGGSPSEGGGGEPGNGDEQCEGVYSDWTLSDVEDQTTSGACVNDVAAICGRDLNTEAGDCGKGCFLANMSDNEAIAECTLECVKEREDPDPSDACLACYLQSVDCARVNCLAPCVEDPAGQACVQCRIEAGCTAGFYTCSGLPEP